MGKQRRDIAEQLRQAIAAAEKRGMSRYAIAKKAGVQQSQLSRYMAGENIPRLDTADRIAAAIGKAMKLSDL